VAARPQRPQGPMQTPSGPEPLMQREPGRQSSSYLQVFPVVARFAGAGTLSSSEVGSPMQLPSLHVELGSLQSVSNTQAKAGVEVRQRIMITIRLRTLVPPNLEQPFQNHIAECQNLDMLRLVVPNEEIALRSQIPLPQRTSPGTG
jgi:hypothetical protein